MANGLRHAIGGCLALWAAWAGAVGVPVVLAADADQHRRVLILYPGDERMLATNIVGAALNKRLEGSDPTIRVDSEFLDLLVFSDDDDEDRLAEFLAGKYADGRPDVVVALGPPALDFIVAHRDAIAPQARIAFGLVETPRDFGPAFRPGDVAGVFSEYSLSKTMELAERLQPDARQVVVVSGASEFDRNWAETAREDLAPWAGSHDIEYLVGLPLADVIAAVSQLPRDAILLVTTFYMDGTGRRLVNLEAVGDIAKAATAPSYGPYDTYLGEGFVGGYSTTFASTGESLADLTGAMLAGSADVSSDRHDAPAAFRVDARQLKRWDLPAANLPPGTVILFEEKSFWDEYREIAIAVIAVLAIQSVLLVALLINRVARRRAERALAENQARMTRAAEAARVGLWHFDLPRGGFWTSEYCREMFGIDHGEAVTPTAILTRVHDDDRAAIEAQLLGLVAGTPINAEFRAVLPDGTCRWLQVISAVTADGPGGEARISGIFKDVSERRRASIEAQEQRNEVARISRVLMLGEMSWTIAHELNQPLTGILANAEAAQLLLARQPADLEQTEMALSEIVEDAERAGQVIQRLRRLLKKGENRTEVVDINEIFRSAHVLIRSELISRQISVAMDFAPDSVPAVGDPVQLQQVALNLLVNAMDAVVASRQPRREIVIATRWHNAETLEATVSDNGPGIGSENAGQVLQPFFSTKEHGLGLGLSICTSIVEAHGGSLHLSDADGGVGTVARIRLPASVMAAAAQ